MAKIYDGATYLGSHLSANDYYAEGESVTGVWRGEGAKLLGLVGNQIHSNDAAFRRLRLNQHPQTEESLTERTSKSRVAFFDFQCSAPKSVSILAVTFADERLRAAHEIASHEAFAFLEKFAARRVRKGAAAWSEATRMTGNLCAAVFKHDASRALDAQLHSHFVVANATFDISEQRWCALTEVEILKAIRCSGKVYQASLAKAVIASGYSIELTRDARGHVTGFEISGVTEADRAIASQRRAAIEKAIGGFHDQHDRTPTKKEVDHIVRTTRENKLTEISTEEVRRRQLCAFAVQRRLALYQLVDQSRSIRPAVAKLLMAPAIAAARDHLFERQSVVPAHELIAECLNQNLGKLEPELVINAVNQGCAGVCQLAQFENPESALLGTRDGILAEIAAVSLVNEGLGNQVPLGPIDFPTPEYFSEIQRSCITGILGSCDTIIALRGVAGAGKTTVLSVLESGLHANGIKSFYCAPTSSAVEVLKSEGFANAATLAGFLLRSDCSPNEQLRGALIVVDEAGLISMRQGAALFELAQASGARILLVGDARQHSAVEAGDFLALLETHSRLRSHELTDIRRQTVAAYRKAIQALACGNARAGLLALDALGYVNEAGEDYLSRAADAYLSHGDSRAILVSPTWVEIDAVTDLIRDRKHQNGELAIEVDRAVFRSLKWTNAHKRRSINYAAGHILSIHSSHAAVCLTAGTSLEVVSVGSTSLIVRDKAGKDITVDPAKWSQLWDVGEKRILKLSVGDLILIQQNHKTSRLTNGDVLKVEAVSSDGTITASDKTGNSRTIPASFGAINYGYAITSHKSQGRTSDHVIICAARLDSKSTYVAFSRGRKSAACFTPDKAALIAGLPMKASARRSALDVLGGLPRTSAQRRVRRRRRWRMIQLTMRLARRAVGRAAAAAVRVFTFTPDSLEQFPPQTVKKPNKL